MLIGHFIVARNFIFLLRVELSFPANICDPTTCTPSDFIDRQCFVHKMSALNITDTFSFNSCTSFWQDDQVIHVLNSYVARSWVHEGRQFWVRATSVQCLLNCSSEQMLRTCSDNSCMSWAYLEVIERYSCISVSPKQRPRDTISSFALWNMSKCKCYNLSFSLFVVWIYILSRWSE